jgi:NAD(P)H dehydrogenase (quinone)
MTQHERDGSRPGTGLVVLASPEPSSFAAALAHTAAGALEESGWRVTLLDLYAEGFDPVLSARDFTTRLIPERLQPMDEQAHAAAGGTFDPELARHVELFLAADLLLLVSPMWWFSVPAMLKGWIDRVFANGVAYRYPDVPPWSGHLGAKRSRLIMTSSYEAEQFHEGRCGDLERVLHPLLHGTLAYTGMQVLEPFIAYAADSVDDRTRGRYLSELRAQIAALPPVPAGEGAAARTI